MYNINWYSINEPPKVYENDYGMLESKPLLTMDKFGNMFVATYSLGYIDDRNDITGEMEYSPKWFTINCSERWDVTNSIVCWTPLPNPP